MHLEESADGLRLRLDDSRARYPVEVDPTYGTAAATFTGEAEQAAPLLKLLDSSPYFRDSSFSIPIVKTAKSEMFHIRAARRPR